MIIRYNKKALGKIIKEKDISHGTLSLKSGISRQQINILEAGVNIPNGKTIAKLAAALGVTPNDFFEIKED